MNLLDIYEICGLESPDQYLKNKINDGLFNGKTFIIEDILAGRKTGKTTNFMMMAIFNLANEKSTVIWNTSHVAIRFNIEQFRFYARNFSKTLGLKRKYENCSYLDYFYSDKIDGNPIICFNNKVTTKQSGIYNSTYFHFEYDDSVNYPWEIKEKDD